MKGLFTTIVSIFITVVLIVGFVFDFDYLRDIELGFHDTYIISNPKIIVVAAFIYSSFLVFLIKGIRQKMNSKLVVWPIAITNFLLLGSLIYLMHLSYLMLSIAYFDLLGHVDHTPYQSHKNRLIVSWMLPILVLTLLEFFLVKKLVGLHASQNE